jgi:serine/threonine protein phosphatase PrpC
MNWEITQADHIGGRNEQQDSLTFFSTSDNKTHLLVVADGMGGHKGGRLASQCVIEAAQLTWDQYQPHKMINLPFDFLQTICELAHNNINELAKKQGFLPHSTCVLLFIHHQKAWWAHIGDSRLYHFRRNKYLQRTKDHSVVQLLVDLGRITEEEMATHPDQGRLLNGLGGSETAKPEFGQASIYSGDSFVLCSDGFWEYVSPKKMIKVLLRKDISLKKRINLLVEKVLDVGGDDGDNIAVIVAQFKGKNILSLIIYTIFGLMVIGVLGWNLWPYLKTLLL